MSLRKSLAFIVIALLSSISIVNVSGQEVVKQYFPAIDNGRYFVWDTNITQNLTMLKTCSIETRGEKMIIDNYTETETIVQIFITVCSWRYIDGEITDIGNATFIYNIPKEELENYSDIQCRLFNTKNLYKSLRHYLEGLSGFFITNNSNFTLSIHDGFYVYSGMNRSVLVGLLEGYTASDEFTHARYIVDKEYGVVLEREFWRIKNSTAVKTQQFDVIERMVLRDTNLFEITPASKQTVFLAIVIIAIVCTVIALISWLKRKW